MTSTITAIFDTREESEQALRKLELAGFSKENITMLVSEETRSKHFGIEEGTKASGGAVTGATVGGLVGALYLALASAGTLMVPGLNLVVGGALIGGLVGLGAGAATGGLVGALVGLGIPEHEAKLYEGAVRKGSILIAVDVSNDARAEKVKLLLKETNAQSINSLAA